MKRYRAAIVLALVLGVLSAIAYWDEWKTGQEIEEEAAKNKLLTFKPEEVSAISYEAYSEEFDKGEQVKFKLMKKDGEWFITEPVSAKAQAVPIENFIRSLVDYKYTKEVSSSKADWNKYSLDHPVKEISFSLGDKADSKQTIYVGSKAAVGYLAYVRTNESDKSYIGSQILYTETTKRLNDFRDATIATIDVEKVNKVKIKKAPADVITFAKDQAGFKFVPSTKAAVDKESVSEYINELNSARALEFLDNPMKSKVGLFAGKKLSGSVSWTLDNGSSSTLLFAKDGSEVLMAYDPTKIIFRVDPKFGELIQKKIFDFQDRNILKLSSNEVSEVDLDGESFAKVDNAWYASSDVKILIDKKSVEKPEPRYQIQALLSELSQAKARNLLKAEQAAKIIAAAPLHRVKLKLKKEQGLEEVVVDAWKNKDEANNYVVRVSGKSETFSVDKAVLSALEKDYHSDSEFPDDGHDHDEEQNANDESIPNLEELSN